MAPTASAIQKEIDTLKQKLARLEIAAEVFEELNGTRAKKLKTLDAHAHALANGNGLGPADIHAVAAATKRTYTKRAKPWREMTPEEKRARWREQSQAKRDKQKAAGTPAAKTKPPKQAPADPTAALDVSQYQNVEWGGETSKPYNARALLLMDDMRQAAIPLTHANVRHLYKDVLKWGARPGAQYERYGLAKLTKKGWKILGPGLERIAQVRALLAERQQAG